MEFLILVPAKLPGSFTVHRSTDRFPQPTDDGGVVVGDGFRMDELTFESIVIGQLTTAPHIVVMWHHQYKWCFYDRRVRALTDRLPATLSLPEDWRAAHENDASGTVKEFLERAWDFIQPIAVPFNNERFPNKELTFTAETTSVDSLAELLKRLPDGNRGSLSNRNGTWVLTLRKPGMHLLDKLQRIAGIELWKDDVLVTPHKKQ